MKLLHVSGYGLFLALPGTDVALYKLLTKLEKAYGGFKRV